MAKLILNLTVLSMSLFMSLPTFANQNINNFVKKAKQNLTNNFLDPDAAKFRNLEVKEWIGAEDKKYFSLCGEVNAKNSHGAYTGFKLFNASATDARIIEENKAGVMAVELIFHNTYCGPDAKLIKKIDK
jgi:hypothetical protein